MDKELDIGGKYYIQFNKNVIVRWNAVYKNDSDIALTLFLNTAIKVQFNKYDTFQVVVIEKRHLIMKGHISKPKYLVKGKDFYAIIGHNDIELIPCEEALCLINIREQEHNIGVIIRQLSRTEFNNSNEIINLRKRLFDSYIELGKSYLASKEVYGYTFNKQK